MGNELVQVQFHGEYVETIRCGNGAIKVSIRRVCEPLGIDFSGQIAKLKTKSWATVELISTVAEDGKQREVACIDLDSLPMWLATIEPSRVPENISPKLEWYQKECAKVLRDHFFPASRSSGDDLIDTIQSVQVALAATVELRREQIATSRTAVEAKFLAERANEKATAALAQAESNLGYFSLLAYARRTSREITWTQGQRYGRELSQMCRDRGVRVGSISDPRFGIVNTYPESVLVEYFNDSLQPA